MPSVAVKAAFDARMQEFMSGSPPLFDAITYGEPTSGDSFIELQFPVVNGVQPVLSRRFFEEGGARFVINARRTTMTEEQAYEIADQIGRIFRVRVLLHTANSRLDTFVPDPPIVNDNSNEGNWFSLSVIVPFRYQFDDPE